MASITSFLEVLAKSITKNQASLILIIALFLAVGLPYISQKKNLSAELVQLKMLNENIKALNDNISNNKLNNLTKAGARFLYTKSLGYTKYDIYIDMVKIIDQEDYNSMMRQIEIRDNVYNKISIYYRRDFSDLSMYYYDGIPLSFVMREFKAKEMTDLLCNYLFTHTHDQPKLIKSGLREQLETKIDDMIVICTNSLDRDSNSNK